MKILVLDEWIPYPADTGKKLRTFNLISRLARTNEITFLCFHGDPAAKLPQRLLDMMEIVIVPDNRIRKRSLSYYFRVFFNLFKPDPFSVEYSKLDSMTARLSTILAEQTFDALICEWTPYAHYFQNLDHPCKVLMAHNVEFQQWERMFRSSRNLLMKVLYFKQWKSMYRFERDQFLNFRSVMTVSELDKKLVNQMTGHELVNVVENGVDLEYFKPVKVERLNRLVFSASMDAFANQSGAIYFANKVYPLVRRSDASLEFYIVGREPNQSVQALASKEGVVVTGSVDDVRPYISQSLIAVIPLLAGGGTRLKILEAMAMGIPVISTSIGAEGLGVTHGHDILIADTEEDFANSILKCTADEELREKLASNGLKLASSKYNWDNIAQKMNRYLQEMTS